MDIDIFYIDYPKYMILYECKSNKLNKSYDNLWIFSRTPVMDPEVLNEALEKTAEYFNIETLKFVKQEKAYCGDYMN